MAYLRIEFEGSGIQFKNISGAASSTDHPFINTDLGIYFDHLKGPERKRIGQSFIEDYKMQELQFVILEPTQQRMESTLIKFILWEVALAHLWLCIVFI